MALQQVIYTAHATATGGRDGRAVSSDQHLDVALARPKELGGNGQGTNPEQLFAGVILVSVQKLPPSIGC